MRRQVPRSATRRFAVIAIAFDARDRESCAAWVERTAGHFGRIDALVNNAGISRTVGIEDDDEVAYDEMWDVNVKGRCDSSASPCPTCGSRGAGVW